VKCDWEGKRGFVTFIRVRIILMLKYIHYINFDTTLHNTIEYNLSFVFFSFKSDSVFVQPYLIKIT
jgi:hypothetical protein